MRQLATIRRILDIKDVEDTDFLQHATIDGWKVVINKKDELKIGDLVIYCEIDSILPDIPEFEFLRSKKYRIKTQKIRGVLSQGIVFPLSILDVFVKTLEPVQEGLDVTDIMRITKYEPPLERMPPTIKGNFPSFIPKTDEERGQNLIKKMELFKTYDNLPTFLATEKLDGTSATYYLDEMDDIHCCSRNWEVECDETNIYWQMAMKYKLEYFLTVLKNADMEAAIQGEIVGPGIQGNKYKLDENRLYIFNVYSLKNKSYLPTVYAKAFMELINVPFVPVVQDVINFWEYTIDELLDLSDDYSILNSEVKREGIVISNAIYDDNNRFDMHRYSFKIINNSFLLDNKE